MEINFLSEIIIDELITWMDGGSIVLKCKNSTNDKFEIEFMQNVSWTIYDYNEKIPGRLYFNNEIIEQRSINEARVIELLKKACCSNLKKNDRVILDEKIDYITSEKYLKDSEKVKLTNR